MKRSLLAILLLPALFIPAHAATPDLGPNVLIFSPSTPPGEMQQKIDAIYADQQHAEFGLHRNAIFFLPGNYHVDIPIGFYTELRGLGASPDDTHITGNVHVDATLPHDNATCVFWRSAENLSISPATGAMQWAVSQAVPFRRMHIHGDLVLHQHNGWVSGGWASDSLIDGTVDAGPQQQWISRNTEWSRWTGSNWNMVFVGDTHVPAGDWPTPPFTKIPTTPVIREKPFLVADRSGTLAVRVPALSHDSTGITWRSGQTPGTTIPLTRFYIAHPGDTAATINHALASGKNLLLTPGIYDLSEPIRVIHANTIVLGLGFATLHPINGTAAMTTADVDGIILAGLLFDAGAKTSPILLEVGSPSGHHPHATNPISLHDIFFRVGGGTPGRTDINLRINANDTIIDHTWIWRADHGPAAGWTINPSNTGLVVNADNVTAYGLFVEHHQHFQVLWNGNHGRTFFYQSEIPYDPPTQPDYTSAPNTDGWASYKIASTVTTHDAWGLGIYSVFTHPDVNLTRAIESPTTPGIHFHHMITVALGNRGRIDHVIDNTGAATSITPRVTPRLTDFPTSVPPTSLPSAQ